MPVSVEDIDRYLDGDMDAAEAAAFEEAMASGTELSEAVALQRQLRRGIIAEGNAHLKARLETLFIEEERGTGPGSPNGRWVYWFGFFLILALAALGIWYLFLFRAAPVPEALFAEYYHPYEASLAQRGALEEQMERADALYHRQEYTQAAAALESLLNEQAGNARLQLLLGICYLEVDRNREAREMLVAAAGNPLYREQATWYQALLSLKMGRVGEARQALKSILEGTPAPEMERQAWELLDALR